MSPILGKVPKNNNTLSRLDQEKDIKQHDNYNPEFACMFQNFTVEELFGNTLLLINQCFKTKDVQINEHFFL